MKNGNICVRLSPEEIQHLKMTAHRISVERQKNISMSDLVREAIKKMFPQE